MTTQRAPSKFRLKWFASIIPNGVIDDSNPPAIYEVIDEHNEVVGLVENKRASSLPPLWQASLAENGHKRVIGGFYDTAEGALTALQSISFSEEAEYWWFKCRICSRFHKGEGVDRESHSLNLPFDSDQVCQNHPEQAAHYQTKEWRNMTEAQRRALEANAA